MSSFPQFPELAYTDSQTSPISRRRTITVPATTPEFRAERSRQLAIAAAKTALDNRGRNIVVLDMRELTPIFDYFVIATGSSRRQLHAMSEEIDHTLEDDLDDKRMGIEGYHESRWILLDYGSVVIHLFDEDAREYYALENLWSSAERVELPWKEEEEDGSEPEIVL